MSDESNCDLTTDAIPSPPRDEVKQEETEPTNIPPKMKTKTRVFKKSKKSEPTAFASVINISNANGIHVGSNYNVYLSKTETQPQKKDYIVTEPIRRLFDSGVPVDRKALIFLSPHINEHWRTMARALDFSDGQISQFYEDYIRSGIKEVIYQLLLDWIQNDADRATVGKLSKVLWDTNQQDAVKRWSEYIIKN
ncbi:protein immune deficiency [Tribolium madens]|uniref:protein immune deficiency n=1 Tax=Tribolium madens TaxID=41895 RepID=UPI001CF74613|nr:protein immune deficiency [Tribolium madens]